LHPKVFEATELSDGSIRIIMEIGGVKEGVARAVVKKDLVHVAVSKSGQVHWEGIFHLPFKATNESVSCVLKNSFIELVAKPVGPVKSTKVPATKIG
jgi:hypothetical protein